MKRLILSLILLLSGLFALAQSYPNGLSADSVDPEADARFISEMKAKMDKVRRTQHRPIVALVLSGGGARGSAHVGVMKVLEEMKIPVDMICGTSMGGLMGGLYSMGYTANQLDSLLKEQDWDFILSDDISSKYKPYKEKVYRSKYLLTIPFHYQNAADNPRHVENLDLGAGAADLSTQSGLNTLGSSLPSGYVTGFNLNNLMSSLTVGYQDSIAFSNLPIPYFSVATDMNSCKAKNWGSGNVRYAMRSTMSIPGMFSPVWTDNMVLVDGGTRNNFPADLARAMGADYVIGVELSAAAAENSEVDNIGNIVMRFIKMLGQDSYNQNIGEADVLIKPDLEGYGMLSFDTASIDTMITRGYRAAKLHMDELKEVKSHMNAVEPRLNARPATDISQHPVSVSAIEFPRLNDRESRTMMRKIGLDVTKKISKSDLDEAMQEIVSVPAFETATYSLLGNAEPYRLQFNCAKKPVHQLGLGVRMDTQDWAALLLNIGLNTNKLEGSKLDFESRIAQNFYAKLHYSLDLLALPTLNAEFKWFNSNHDFVSTEVDMLMSAQYSGHEESVYFSNSRWTALNLQAGIKNYHFKTKRLMSQFIDFVDVVPDDRIYGAGGHDTGPYYNGNFPELFFNANIYTYDSKYFPRRGIDLNAKAEWYFANHEYNRKSCPIAAVDFGYAFSIGKHFSVVTDIHARSIMEVEPCLFACNAVGGIMESRYWSQQIPFVGFQRMYLCENNLLLANAEVRVNPAKNFYISALAGAFDACNSIENMFSDLSKTIIGFGGQLSYNTIGGPIRARVSWSTLDRKVNYVISAGFDF